jgi:hypothetical protein
MSKIVKLAGQSLRGDIIRVAHAMPELRDELLPIVSKEAKGGPQFDPFYRTFPVLFKSIAKQLKPVSYRAFMAEMGSTVVQDPDDGKPKKLISLKGPQGIAMRHDMWKEWQKPRVRHNSNVIFSQIALNTGKRLKQVKKDFMRDLHDIWSNNPAGRKIAEYTMVLIGRARDMADAAKKLAGRAPALPGFARSASDQKLRKQLIRLAKAEPSMRRDILEVLGE